MKLSLLVPAVLAFGTGYALGAAAGYERYRQIAAVASRLVASPRVQEAVFDLADRAQTTASHLPGPAADLLDDAATRVQDTLTQPE